MKDILSLMYQQRPLEYLLDSSKKRLEQVTSLYNEYHPEKTNIFLLDKERYFKYLFLIHSLFNLRSNLLNETDLNLYDLPVDTSLSYSTETHIYKGITHDNMIHLEKVPSKRIGKHTAPLNRYLPNNKSNREKITLLTDVKRGVKVKDSVKHIPLLFDLNLNKVRISKSILMVGNNKLLNDVSDAKFKIENENYSFSDIFITAKLSRDSLDHSYYTDGRSSIKSLRRPSIIYATDLYQASRMLGSNYSKKNLLTSVSEVIIFGDHYINDNNLANLSDLLSIAYDNNLKVSLYGTTKPLNDSYNHSILKSLNIYAWTPPYIYNSKRISIQLLDNEATSIKNLEYIYEKLNVLLLEGNLYLFFKINKILSLLLKQFYISEDNKAIILSEVAKIDDFTIIDDEFKENLLSLINHDYLKQYSRKIKKELESKQNTILVLPDEYFSIGKQFVRDMNLHADIEPFSNLKYFINDKTKHLFFTYQDPNKINKIIYEFNAYSLNFILPNYGEDKMLRPFSNINKSIKRSYSSNKLSNTQIIDQEWNIEVSSPVVSQKSVDTAVEIVDVLQDNIIKKQIAEKTPRENGDIVLFESNEMVEIKDNEQLFFLDEQEIVNKVTISELDVGDELVIFTLPTSKEVFNMDKENLIGLEFITQYGPEKITEDDVMKDKAWKSELKQYYKKFRLTPIQLTERFARIGYEKSISFFTSWIDSDNSFFAPRDPQFIYYIGKLTSNEYLIDNYQSYYDASTKLKRCTRRYRDNADPYYQGKTITDIKQEWPLLNINRETISNIIIVKK